MNGWKERRNQLSASSLQSILYFTVKMNFPQKVNGSFLALLCPWLKLSMLFYLPGIKSELQTVIQKFPNCQLQAAFESSGLATSPRTHSASAINQGLFTDPLPRSVPLARFISLSHPTLTLKTKPKYCPHAPPHAPSPL